jgi:hypothetical protein
MKMLVTFTYQGGPLEGVAAVNLPLAEDSIGQPAVLHRCHRKPKGAKVTQSAQGLYALSRDESGGIVAEHVASAQDRYFGAANEEEQSQPVV